MKLVPVNHLLLLGCLLFVACSLDETEIEGFVIEFLQVLQKEDEAFDPENSELIRYYPDIADLEQPSGAPEFGSFQISRSQGKIEVRVLSKRTGEEMITLYLAKNKEGNYQIENSNGLIGNALREWEEYAKKIGCIGDSDSLNDQELAAGLKKSKQYFKEQMENKQIQLRSGLTVEKWEWDPDNLTGQIKVRNKTGFEIQGIDYKLELFDKDRNVIDTIEKTLTDELIEEGDAFEGMVNIDRAPDHGDANIHVDVYGGFLERLVRYSEYAGDECNNN